APEPRRHNRARPRLAGGAVRDGLTPEGGALISYCLAVSKPKTAMVLIQDLIEKTTVPYEILLWANTGEKAFMQFVDNTIKTGVPLRMIGKSPYSIGMVAYKILFQEAKFDMIVQVDETVLLVSRKIAEKA